MATKSKRTTDQFKNVIIERNKEGGTEKEIKKSKKQILGRNSTAACRARTDKVTVYEAARKYIVLCL
jgi:hypothetical protein